MLGQPSTMAHTARSPWIAVSATNSQKKYVLPRSLRMSTTPRSLASCAAKEATRGIRSSQVRSGTNTSISTLMTTAATT